MGVDANRLARRTAELSAIGGSGTAVSRLGLKSGQSQFFEPSDWQLARVVALYMSNVLARPSASGLKAVLVGADALLTTESARRRVRIEIERRVRSSAASRETRHRSHRPTQCCSPATLVRCVRCQYRRRPVVHNLAQELESSRWEVGS